jgi:protein-tyrosine phosphatase
VFLDFAGPKEADVPDPYYDRPEGFEQVLNMVEAASRGLLDHVRVHLLRVST